MRARAPVNKRNGRAPVPKTLQLLHGEPGHANRNEVERIPDGVGELISPPPWFDEKQRDVWHHAIEHSPFGLLTETDRQILAQWCCAVVEYEKAVLEVRRGGQVVKTKDGNVIQNPYLPIMNKQALLISRFGAEMGFSPAARTMIGRASGGGYGDGPSRQIDNDLATYLAAKPDRLDG